MFPAFTTDDLNSKFRLDVDDLLEGADSTRPDSENLWKNDEIYGYMTAAVDRWAKDTEGLFKVFQLPVVAAQQFYTLPRYVFKIREMRLITANVYLYQRNVDAFMFEKRDDYGRVLIGYGSIFTATGGPPREYVMDYQTNKVMLIPIPSTADTLEIQCVSTVAIPFSAGMPLPVTDPADQLLILDYMKYQAYSKQDADTIDLKRADGFMQRYDRAMTDRKLELRRKRRSPGTVMSSY